MARHLLGFCLCLGFLVVPVVRAPAADPPPKEAPALNPDDARRGDDYRQFFKKPETTEEFWTALQYEIDVGRFDLASGLLHSLLAKPPTEAELVALEEKYGMAAFLSLRNVDWSSDAKVADQARKDAGQLIDQVREALKKKLGDPERIKFFVKNLNGEPEERDFALRELYRSGGQVVPYVIAALQKARPEERLPLLDALRRLGPETLPPLYAALDSNIPSLQLDIIDVLRKRGAVDAVPFLWRLTAEGQQDDVRRKATRVLSDFLDTAESKLPPAKAALTREAERYYQHRILFADPNAVVVWRWDDAAGQLVRGWPGAEVVTRDKGEEYYGTRFAKEALAIDPSYEPAQNVLLSLALEKGAVQAGPPPGKETLAVKDLLSTVNPDLITAMLERALDDRRPAVILPAVKALGDVDDVNAARPGSHGESVLVRALNYPDRRVQMAAADALMRIPGQPAPTTAGRIIEVWRRALAAEPTGRKAPKAIVGYFSESIGNTVADAVKKSGYDPIQVRTGREVLKRLNEAADVDLVLIDVALPDPGLTSLMAQLRADPNYGRTPVILTVDQKPDEVLGQELEDLRKELKDLRRKLDVAVSRRREAQENRVVAAPVLLKLDEEVRQDENQVRQHEDMVNRKLEELTDKVRRYADRFPNVSAIPLPMAVAAGALQPFLQGRLGEAGTPLSEAELKEYAEKAIHQLADLAKQERPGVDVRPTADSVYVALRSTAFSPEGQIDAIHLVGRYAGPKPQTELADVVLDERRPPKVRTAAAAELLRHIQEHSLTLTGVQIDSLAALYARAGDADLKNELALLMGGMHPDARVTGRRLLNYQPPPPAGVPPPAPPAAPAPPPAPPAAPPAAPDAPPPPKDKG